MLLLLLPNKFVVTLDDYSFLLNNPKGEVVVFLFSYILEPNIKDEPESVFGGPNSKLASSFFKPANREGAALIFIGFYYYLTVFFFY